MEFLVPWIVFTVEYKVSMFTSCCKLSLSYYCDVTKFYSLIQIFLWCYYHDIWCHNSKLYLRYWEFSVPQIEYPLGAVANNVVMACCNCNTIVLSDYAIVWYKCYSDATMVTRCHNSTIWQHNSSTMATINRTYTWLPFLLLPHLVGILFEVLRILSASNNIPTRGQ